MSKLDSEKKNVSVILGSQLFPLTQDKQFYIARLVKWCDENCKTYYFNCHYEDLHDDGVTPKFRHCHLVLVMKKRKRLSTILNSLAKLIELDTLGVQIDETTSFIGAVQYLIHKNNKEKHQYDIKDIVSNVPLEEIETIINSDAQNDVLSLEQLIEICQVANNYIDIMRRIGLNYYHQYRPTIYDILRSLGKSEPKEYKPL